MRSYFIPKYFDLVLNPKPNNVLFFRGTKMFSILLQGVTLVLLSGGYTSASMVSFYGDTKYQDPLLQLEDQMECKNLPESLHTNISSVLTDGCTVFYKAKDCSKISKNDYEILTVAQGENIKLSDYNFRNEIRSFRRCSMAVKKTKVKIFAFVGFPGSKFLFEKVTLSHNECTPIRKVGMGGKLVLLQTGGCLIAYSSKSCSSSGVMMNPTGDVLMNKDLSRYFISGIGSIRACNVSKKFGVVKFFEHENGTGLLQTGCAHEECSPIPQFVSNKTRVAWSTECVVLYQSENCKAIYDNNEHESLNLQENKQTSLKPLGTPVKSYRFCPPAEGGEMSEIVISADIFFKSVTKFPARNACDCQRIPYVGVPYFLINNGICLEFYVDPNCHQWGRTIPGGMNLVALDLFIDPFTNDHYPYFQSFKLCQIFHTCYNITVVAFKIQVDANFAQEFIEGTIQNVDMATKDTFYNNGTATLVKEYSATKKIIETVSVKRVTSVTDTNTKSFEVGITASSEGGVPFVFHEKLEASFKAAYSDQHSSTSSKADTTVTTEEKTFTVSEKIEIPPCTQYEASSFVKVANLPMKYEVFVEVSGISVNGNGEKASIDWVKNNFPPYLEYVEDRDEFTVVGKGRGELMASYGVNSVFSGDGKRIPGCKIYKNSKNNSFF